MRTHIARSYEMRRTGAAPITALRPAKLTAQLRQYVIGIILALATAAAAVPPRAQADVLDSSYSEVAGRYSFAAAASLSQEAACGNLADPGLLRLILEAYVQRRDADYARHLAELQSRLMCLPREGVRAYDLWLGLTLARALALPEAEAKQFVHALFNASILVFDAIQYTGNSAVQLAFTRHNRNIRALLSDYPVLRFPLYVFGPASGRLLALPAMNCSGSLCGPTVQKLLDMFADTTRIWPGWCHIAGMVEDDFRCRATQACAARSGYAMKGSVISAFVRGTNLIGTTLPKLEALLFLSEFADVLFGLPFDPAAQGLCTGALPPNPTLPWAEPSGDLLSCLLEQRREYEASVFCEVPGGRGLDPLVAYAGVGTGVWDQACVLPRGQEFTDAPEPRQTKIEMDPILVLGDRRTGDAGAREVLDTAKRDIVERFNEPIQTRIMQQCQSFSVPSCSGNSHDASWGRVSSEIAHAASVAHYDPSAPPDLPNARADICDIPAGCRDGRRYGSVRLSQKFFDDMFAGRRSATLVTMVHEMLHIVYMRLGFPAEAGIPTTETPITDEERLLRGPVYTVQDEYGEDVTCDGRTHHCLIVQITAHRDQSRQPVIYRPGPFDPVEPTAFGACSAEAERIRTQQACYERLVARIRGNRRRLIAPWMDPRKVYPMPEGEAGLPDRCSQLTGSTVSRPPLSCGFINCMDPSGCRCGGLEAMSNGLFGDGLLRSTYAIDCAQDTELDPRTGKCIPFGTARPVIENGTTVPPGGSGPGGLGPTRPR